jgi:hypothetical protein
MQSAGPTCEFWVVNPVNFTFKLEMEEPLQVLARLTTPISQAFMSAGSIGNGSTQPRASLSLRAGLNLNVLRNSCSCMYL